MSERAHRFSAYGLHIRSDLALPFDPLPDTGGADVDVTVRLGAVPGTLPAGAGRLVRTSLWQARPGAFLTQVEGVARYLLADGRDVRIEPLGGDPADIASFLVGLWAVLLQQRGVSTLHAAAVRTPAGAVLLLGRSGHGKSSLAATLVQRGHALLADDVTGLVLNAEQVTVLPSFGSLRLWKHTLKEMRTPPKVRSPVRRGLEKYWVEASDVCARALPVRAAIVLIPSHGADIRMASVPSSDAFWLLCEHAHRKRALLAMGQRPALFRVATMMARHVPVLRAWRPRHPFLLEELADGVEAHMAELGGAAAEANVCTGVAPRREPPAAAPPAPAAVRREQGDAKPPAWVWIACWPKAGSTWLRAVLTNYLRDDGKPASINALIGGWLNGRDEFDEYLGLDSSHMTEEERARHLARFRAAMAERILGRSHRPGEAAPLEPTFVKTHEAYRLPNGPPRFPRGGRVIYLIRNPLDVAVSYAHHLNRPIACTIRLMNCWQAHEGLDANGIHNRSPEPMTTWSNHALSWTEQAELVVHVARYEDLLADPCGGFGAVVRFAGLGLDHARLNRAIERSAFHRLKAQEAEEGFKEKQPTAPSFFRAGAAGSWRDELAPEQVRAIIDAHGHVMGRFGYLREARQFLDTASACRQSKPPS